MGPFTFCQASSCVLCALQDIVTAHAGGKVASLIGIEGGHQFDNSLAALRMFYELGARYVTLTHTCSTIWAGSAGQVPPTTIGLTPFGVQVCVRLSLQWSLSSGSSFVTPVDNVMQLE